MHMKVMIFCLILLMQACGPLLAQTSTPPEPDSPGILQRMVGRAWEAKAKVQHVGGTMLDFLGAYYEDHIEPVTDSYAEWASNIKSSMWENVQTTIVNYIPLMGNYTS